MSALKNISRFKCFAHWRLGRKICRILLGGLFILALVSCGRSEEKAQLDDTEYWNAKWDFHDKDEDEEITYPEDETLTKEAEDTPEEKDDESREIVKEDKKDSDSSKTEAERETKRETEESEDWYEYEDNEEENNRKIVDLIIFAGQSNMAGHGGNAAEAPEVPIEAGMEFRSISDPTGLYKIEEPFGLYENSPAMNDYMYRAGKGTLTSAFVNEYYSQTGVPVVAISASKGGMSSRYWTSHLVTDEIIGRFTVAKEWLLNNGYSIGNQLIVFLQGENDALENVPVGEYVANMRAFADTIIYRGIDKIMMIRIGSKQGDRNAFLPISAAQTELCRIDRRFVLVSTMLSAFGDGDMVDTYHFNQRVLNAVGTDAARNTASFVMTRRDPEIKDYFTDTTYVPLQ